MRRNNYDLCLQRQGEAFLRRYADNLSDSVKKMLSVYARLDEYGFITKGFYRLKYGFLYSSLLMNLRILLFR